MTVSGTEIRITDAHGETTTITSTAPGESLMELARANGVAGIDGDCGGGCACATCHVYVAPEWWDKVGAPDDIEADMLDMVSDVRRETSRLSCQIKLSPEFDGLYVTVAPVSA